MLKDEALIDVEATRSDAISGSIALDFLKGFLAWIGGGANSVSSAVEASKSKTVRFKFGGCKRDHVTDAFDLDWKLSEVAFDKKKSAMRDGYQYYIVTAVHTCTELTFEVLDKNMSKIDMSGSVDAAGGAKANFSVSKDGQVTAKSQRKLAYGVELNEIAYDEKRKQLQLLESQNYVHVAAVQQVLPKAQIGGPAGTMVLSIEDWSAAEAPARHGYPQMCPQKAVAAGGSWWRFVDDVRAYKYEASICALDVYGRLRTSLNGSPGRIPNDS